MLTGERYDAMCEILDVCAERAPSLLLVKGISIYDQLSDALQIVYIAYLKGGVIGR